MFTFYVITYLRYSREIFRNKHSKRTVESDEWKVTNDIGSARRPNLVENTETGSTCSS